MSKNLLPTILFFSLLFPSFSLAQNFDHLSSTRYVTNEKGEIIQSMDYTPYGKETNNQKYTFFDEQRGYIGEEYDDTGLLYLNARYYNPEYGVFLSQDPLIFNMPRFYILDPQQQNPYLYARGNPVVGKDPSGLLTIIVPGTKYDENNWSMNGGAKDFISSVGKTFGETPIVINDKTKWTGGNSQDARMNAAQYITDQISAHEFKDGEKLNIVGHSHGGNVGILVSQMSDHKIDNLVTLGTPVRPDYKPDYENIGRHINGYSNLDAVQTEGGKILGFPKMGLGINALINVVPTNANRQFNRAENIGVTFQAKGGLITSHFNLWRNESVWNKIDSHIK